MPIILNGITKANGGTVTFNGHSLKEVQFEGSTVWKAETYIMQNGTMASGYTVTTNGALNGNTGYKCINYTSGTGLVTLGIATGSTYYGRAWTTAIDASQYNTLTFKLNSSNPQWRYEKYWDAGNHNQYDKFSGDRYVTFGVATNTATGTGSPTFVAYVRVNSGAVGEKLASEYTVDISSVTGMVYPTIMIRWTNSGIYDEIISDIMLS